MHTIIGANPFPPRESRTSALNGAKAFELSAHSPAPRETAPELWTVWRWKQSRANPSLWVIPYNREINSDFSALDSRLRWTPTDISLEKRLPEWSNRRKR